jgi:hypothetical protein
VEKVELDTLFGGVKHKTVDIFADGFDTDIKNENPEILKAEKKHSSASESTAVTTNITESIFKALEESEKVHEVTRKWYLVVPNYNNYGPYTSEEIYSFLHTMSQRSPLAENHNLMVCDTESDIYYKPEIVLEMLGIELKDKIKNLDSQKELLDKFLSSPLNLDNSNHRNIRERKFSGNPNLITKYDVYEMNSEFKTAHYLPIKQLKEQLNSMRNHKQFNNYNNNNTKRNIPNNPNIPNTNRLLINNNEYLNKFNKYTNNNSTPKKKNNINFNREYINTTCKYDSCSKVEPDSHFKIISITTDNLFA